MLRFGLTFGLTVLGGAASACSEVQDSFNNPLVTRADCSFANADGEPGRFGRDQLSGGKAYDRGDGRLAQRVTIGSSCSSQEWLVFTECDTGEAIAIMGRSVESLIAGTSFVFVAQIQPPNGPIRADRTDTVMKLAGQAKANDLFFEVKSRSDNEPNGRSTFGLWQNYRSDCGCKKFYPGSAGADS